MISLQVPFKLALRTTKPISVLKPALGAAAYRSSARFYASSTGNRPAQVIKPQSVSPHAPIGVSGAVDAESDPSIPTRPKIWDEFSLADRVAIVTGGNRGLGLEMALALAEAGARAVYCLDLPKTPGEDFRAAQKFVEKMGTGGMLEYISADVTDQKKMWDLAEKIGDREGRMDVCIACAGILPPDKDCLEYPAEGFRKVRI
ncbi:hypothetical protein EWM64_g481 [Hericium alpestre]|uniref:Ketoreductase (KR) domain-containing protein n=1 Tax=Hericium alpestre TaxID=135208 RepID=A0A4Z0A8Z7_9AGAM|nr:hypothetical protein EWM64_g481 [Hericium alpestre]